MGVIERVLTKWEELRRCTIEEVAVMGPIGGVEDGEDAG